MAEQFSKYFKFEEFIESSTARQKSLQNIPSWEQVLRLRQLARFLDELREAWGSGIRVTSGFRCDALNKAVGGVPNSIHRIAWAADIFPINGKIAEFKKFVRNWVKDKDFDQVILEKDKKGNEWIHLGLFNNAGQQRHQLFSLTA